LGIGQSEPPAQRCHDDTSDGSIHSACHNPQVRVLSSVINQRSSGNPNPGAERPNTLVAPRPLRSVIVISEGSDKTVASGLSAPNSRTGHTPHDSRRVRTPKPPGGRVTGQSDC